MQALLQKIEPVIINGAIGDALGAGYEIITGDALPKHQRPLAFIQSDNGEPGSVTDDTGMTVAGMVGIERAMQQLAVQSAKSVDTDMFMAELLRQTHIAYLQWGANQKTHSGYQAQALPAFLKTLAPPAFPDALTPFLHTKGPGPGTLKVLNKAATGEYPVGAASDHFAPGCGGMMRVSPFAFLSVMSKGMLDPFTIGVQTAQLTHPTPSEACLATGVVCALIARGLSEGRTNMRASLHAIKEQYLSVSEKDDETIRNGKIYTRLAIEAAEEIAQKPYTQDAADDAARLFFERARAVDPQHGLYGNEARPNFFYALPVLTQSLTILLSQEKEGWSVDDTLAAAVLHDGDSDSVGAIVGNIMGTRTAEKSQRLDELKPEYQRGITEAVRAFSSCLQQASPLLSHLRPGNEALKSRAI